MGLCSRLRCLIGFCCCCCCFVCLLLFLPVQKGSLDDDMQFEARGFFFFFLFFFSTPPPPSPTPPSFIYIFVVVICCCCCSRCCYYSFWGETDGDPKCLCLVCGRPKSSQAKWSPPPPPPHLRKTWVQHINTRQNKQTSLHVGLLKNHSLRVCSNVEKRLIPQALLNRAYIIYFGKCAVK